jgi:hypothetical protein
MFFQLKTIEEDEFQMKLAFNKIMDLLGSEKKSDDVFVAAYLEALYPFAKLVDKKIRMEKSSLTDNEKRENLLKQLNPTISTSNEKNEATIKLLANIERSLFSLEQDSKQIIRKNSLAGLRNAHQDLNYLIYKDVYIKFAYENENKTLSSLNAVNNFFNKKIPDKSYSMSSLNDDNKNIMEAFENSIKNKKDKSNKSNVIIQTGEQIYIKNLKLIQFSLAKNEDKKEGRFEKRRQHFHDFWLAVVRNDNFAELKKEIRKLTIQLESVDFETSKKYKYAVMDINQALQAEEGSNNFIAAFKQYKKHFYKHQLQAIFTSLLEHTNDQAEQYKVRREQFKEVWQTMENSIIADDNKIKAVNKVIKNIKSDANNNFKSSKHYVPALYALHEKLTIDPESSKELKQAFDEVEQAYSLKAMYATNVSENTFEF